MRDDDALATILLVSRLCADGVRPLKASEFWSLLDLVGRGPIGGIGRDGESSGAESGVEPDSLPDGAGPSSPTGSASDESGVEPDSPWSGPGVFLGQQGQPPFEGGLSEDLCGRIAGLMGRATAMAFELDRLERSGIRTVTAFDDDYPQHWLSRLGAKAPPLVYAAGAFDLLGTPGLGVVGSRDVSEAGGKIARAVAQVAARRGLPLVSGGARGVDQLAMDAAHQAGGAVVGILAESLTRKLKRPDVRRAVYDGSTVLCTPYSPDAPFSAGNAMGRNKLIYAQGALTVVVASDAETGGTWSGANETLKHRLGRVAVWRGDGEGPGNELLQQRGAEPVSSIDDIGSLLDEANSPQPGQPAPQPTAPRQQSFFSTPPPP